MRHDSGAILTGLGLGAGLMYFFDPQRGRRRRAGVRDRVVHAAHAGSDAMGATSRDVGHRVSGTTARIRRALRHETVDDDVVVERVRSRLGRVVSHPHAIDVHAADGVVILRGPVLQAEVKGLLGDVAGVRGVRNVVSELEEHKEPGTVPALQGGSTPAGLQADVWHSEWSPATRLLTGTTGLGLAGYGASRRDAKGALLAAAGVGLVARAATNLDTRRLTGIGGRSRAVDLQKTVTIAEP